MHRLEPMPEYIGASLAAHGINPETVVLCASADLANDGTFAETWLAVDSEKLCILSGQTTAEHELKQRNTHTSADWSEVGYRTIQLAVIGEVKAQSLNGNGLLTILADEQPEVVCRYSNTMTRKFGQFAVLLNKLCKGEALTDRDFADEIYQPRCPTCGLLYRDPKRRVCPRCLDKRALFMRVLSFVPRYKKQVALILLFMGLSSGLQVFNPYLSGRIFWDQVLTPNGRYSGRIVEIILAMILVQFLSILTSVAHGRVTAGMAAQVVFDLKTQVFAAMQRLSLGFFTSKETGTLMTRINQDATHLQGFFHDGLPYFIVNSINLVGVTVVMLSMNWRLTLLVLIPTPFIVLMVRKVFPKLWNAFSRRYRRTSALNSLVNDALNGIRVVKAFGKEATERERFAVRNKDVYAVNMRVGYIQSTVFPSMTLLMRVGRPIVLAYGGWLAINAKLTFGELMTFLGYLNMLYGPLEFMTHIVDWWSSCMNSAQRIFEILDAVPDVAERPDPVRISPMKGHIKLDHISFGYEVNKPVLQDISLELKPGEMLGVLGYSGAGKSTLVNLISRLYDVQDGRVEIDGVDVRDAAISDLRSQIGMVLQETYLFAGTIAENIAYAKPEATTEEIIEACKVARAHDFIVKLPNGYDTVIGHRGQNLSGGERQRIAIARAILHNPRILILDEATASVDTETERSIQEGLERLVQGRTTIAIAHRLSTLRNADRLMVLDKGKVAEIGTHDELVKLQGHYYRMLEKQRNALKIRGVEVSEHEISGRAG